MRKNTPLCIGIMTLFLLLAVSFLPMQTVWAEDGATETLLDDDYYIDTYHVDIEGDLINELENNGLYF